MKDLQHKLVPRNLGWAWGHYKGSFVESKKDYTLNYFQQETSHAKMTVKVTSSMQELDLIYFQDSWLSAWCLGKLLQHLLEKSFKMASCRGVWLCFSEMVLFERLIPISFLICDLCKSSASLVVISLCSCFAFYFLLLLLALKIYTFLNQLHARILKS